MAAISLLLSACNLWQDDFEEEVLIGEGHTLIRPNTILQDIAQGNDNVFFSPIVTSEGTSHPTVVVNWRQEDFLLIAKSLFKQIWSESIDDWDLDSMVFRLGCKDIDNGPQYGGFTFSKIVEVGNKTSRKRRDIFIDPSISTVSWIERAYTPNLARHGPIDLLQVMVKVEHALQIAEQNGGNQIRAITENSCEIFLTLSPGSRYEGWQISYSKFGNERVSTLLEATVNPQSGKIELFKPRR